MKNFRGIIRSVVIIPRDAPHNPRKGRGGMDDLVRLRNEAYGPLGDQLKCLFATNQRVPEVVDPLMRFSVGWKELQRRKISRTLRQRVHEWRNRPRNITEANSWQRVILLSIQK